MDLHHTTIVHYSTSSTGTRAKEWRLFSDSVIQCHSGAAGTRLPAPTINYCGTPTRVVLEYMYTHCTVYSGVWELELLLAATCLPELGHALADGQPRQEQSGTVRKPPS